MSAQRPSERTRRLRIALSRLLDDEDGLCAECGDSIPPKRLVAVPRRDDLSGVPGVSRTHGASPTVDSEHRNDHAPRPPGPVPTPCARRRTTQGGGGTCRQIQFDFPRNDPVAPVRIFDADGTLVCVRSADEFRRTHPTIDTADSTSAAHRRRSLNGPRPRSVPLPGSASPPPASRPIAGTRVVTLERVEDLPTPGSAITLGPVGTGAGLAVTPPTARLITLAYAAGTALAENVGHHDRRRGSNREAALAALNRPGFPGGPVM